MASLQPVTIREQIAWSYSNLARAHAAIEDGALKYSRTHHIIRNKLYHGLVSGKVSMRSLYDDERLKLILPQACSYCGCKLNLAVDHLIPRALDGSDEPTNLIWACRSCNSSKQGKDMLVWMTSKGMFPSLLLLRRYIKTVAYFCDKNDLMDLEIALIDDLNLPFDVRLLPTSFPPLAELKLWVTPEQE